MSIACIRNKPWDKIILTMILPAAIHDQTGV